MLLTRRPLWLGFAFAFSLGLACAEDEAPAAGGLGEPCTEQGTCDAPLSCVQGMCVFEGGGDNDADGDGDATGLEGTDGDGDATDAEGEGEGETGANIGLYGGPCLSSDDCEGDLWCGYRNGRFWCASDCMEDADCPSHATATATPLCEAFDEIGGTSVRDGCVLDCVEMGSECPEGAQCFATGIGNKSWCGFLE